MGSASGRGKVAAGGGADCRSRSRSIASSRSSSVSLKDDPERVIVVSIDDIFAVKRSQASISLFWLTRMHAAARSRSLRHTHRSLGHACASLLVFRFIMLTPFLRRSCLSGRSHDCSVGRAAEEAGQVMRLPQAVEQQEPSYFVRQKQQQYVHSPVRAGPC